MLIAADWVRLKCQLLQNVTIFISRSHAAEMSCSFVLCHRHLAMVVDTLWQRLARMYTHVVGIYKL